MAHEANAQLRMKALVAARLLLGDFHSWDDFQTDRTKAQNIPNRQVARRVAAQIKRTYRDLTLETSKFISDNFENCGFKELAQLCDEVQIGQGIYLRLDEFESRYFNLNDRIRRRFPFHAHISISTWGMQFEYPEHHFIRDLESAIITIAEMRPKIDEFRNRIRDPKKEQQQLADLVAREKFLSRSIISAGFSLVEAYLSGLFFEALNRKSIGPRECGETFLSFARSGESAALKERLNRVVRFASNGSATGDDEPFSSFIKEGKLFRDAIHHTTPFGRRDIEAGARLTALYSINEPIAVRCAVLSLKTVLKISHWIRGDSETAIAAACEHILKLAHDIQSSTALPVP